ncbi:2-hydroxy-3-carboxy-6-oxo-7-methylocta-2,4-dienoa te decarboxylase [Mycolicibacterium madagascariense]|uniref:2-hydroxy-3-carboxy-6-oxo-7-methylocta-2,4-dienoa te decarboxylase n=1 Tax=Mycolicibacterium madagascariense TaxID=212765 RepID=A0A7I7XDK7_9MYCO|nr:amidohydrolase family protein [Mycolicibacterium madagascariense]MCV7011391.1 amidohydrolase family protein [Mycolicibacterium madagascariense]BBZ26771.1 2-hydroxy-3-carboxy-6-oxo-7-methylocta-2,4-dienoa te decarboxylase [Mycolicibacterium madagascariense]
MITRPLRPGVVDVHAHWLPRELFELPGTGPHAALHDRDGQLYLGDLPLSIATSAMSDVDAIEDDMRRADVGARVLSAPPFAFPLEPGTAADTYVGDFNRALAGVVADGGGALLGLGIVTLADAGAATSQMEELAQTEGIAGIAIPPVANGRSLDGPPMHHVLREAERLELAVLVHPMQLPRPEWASYYLTNLIGNPVESATAVASLILSGIKDSLPRLRICFVHGGGCAPGLLGRWNHGWTMRADVRSASSRPPREPFAELFFDTVTHDSRQLELLCALAGSDRVVCGSDYPFDMAEADPSRFAVEHGPGRAALIRAAMSYLGLPTG